MPTNRGGTDHAKLATMRTMNGDGVFAIGSQVDGLYCRGNGHVIVERRKEHVIFIGFTALGR
jgi:hypothetical protein